MMTLEEVNNIRTNKISELDNTVKNKKSKEYHEALHEIEVQYCNDVKKIIRKKNGN